MKVTTSFEIHGSAIKKELGIVRGVVVRSPTIGQNLLGGLKQIVGGNIESFAQMCDTARSHAYDRMVASAANMGANAIIGMRYDSSDIQGSGTEVLCYGTAVITE